MILLWHFLYRRKTQKRHSRVFWLQMYLGLCVAIPSCRNKSAIQLAPFSSRLCIPAPPCRPLLPHQSPPPPTAEHLTSVWNWSPSALWRSPSIIWSNSCGSFCWGRILWGTYKLQILFYCPSADLCEFSFNVSWCRSRL